MFRAVPMMRMQAVVLAQDERSVLKGLGRLGAVHLTSTRSGSDTAPLDPPDRAGEMARYDRIRARLQGLRQMLEIRSLSKESHQEYSREDLSGQSQTPFIEMTLDQAEETILSIELRSRDLLEQRQRLMQKSKELTATCEQVSSYRGFDIPLDGFDQFSFLHFVTGSLPSHNLESLGKEIGNNVALLPLVEQKGQQSLFAVTTRQGWQELERVLQRAGFQREILPVVEGSTVDGLSEECQRGQDRLKVEMEQINSRLAEIVVNYSFSLQEIERFVDIEYQLFDAGQKFPRTVSTILISGWVPACDIALLEQRMKEITGGRYAIQTALPDSSTDEVPVLLKHSWLLRPFEMLVSTYGLPNYRELEPTLFVALSYLIMFGMMFGDAGHGFVLVICGLITLFKGRSENIRNVGFLLLFGGTSSVISGVIYGSYFGIETFKKYALWHDPLEGDPMKLMYGAIGIGIVMISLGIILNIINRFRRGDMIGAIFDKFGFIGLLFYWGTLSILLYGEAIKSRGLMALSVTVFLIVPIVGWCLKQPMEHFLARKAGAHDEAGGGLASAFMESCVEAFEAILGYLANTISFVRLAAYAMSHAALIFAAFMLAEVVKEVSFGGGLWSLLVIILGNLVAIILEGIIASVQALRLEYYEFFGKFFSGSGQPFEPFRLTPDSKNPVL
jgi:V/A-type H+-transporting ATPase subunit I